MKDKEYFESAIKKMEDALSLLGEAHTLLAKTSISIDEYQPVSGKLTKSKLELFEVYHEIKDLLKQQS